MALIKTLRRNASPSRELPDLPDAAVAGDRYRLKTVAAAGNTATLSMEPDVFVWSITVGDQATAQTAATNKWVGRAPFACRLVDVKASVLTAPTGATLVVDVNNAGTTMLSTKLSIDASEKTTATAAVPKVIDTAADDIADDAELSVDIDQVGSTVAGAGLKVVLYLQRV